MHSHVKQFACENVAIVRKNKKKRKKRKEKEDIDVTLATIRRRFRFSQWKGGSSENGGRPNFIYSGLLIRGLQFAALYDVSR